MYAQHLSDLYYPDIPISYLLEELFAGWIIKDAIVPLDSEERVNVLTIDDSIFERNRSKKVVTVQPCRNDSAACPWELAHKVHAALSFL